jgi:hypothetical protein
VAAHPLSTGPGSLSPGRPRGRRPCRSGVVIVGDRSPTGR